jgi:2-desacetyl-2-hydroxyethyl bacteriochlorophyllide A dehydrogenase
MIVKEVRFTGLDEVEVVEVDEELVPGPGELLVAPLRIGICGSDLHVLHGKHPFVKPPLVTGHEMVGEVLESGPDKKDFIGQRVLINPLVVPHARADGWRGTANYQEDAAVMGFRLQGLARTRCIVPAAQAHKVPTDLDPSIAVLAEPLAAGLHAARRARARLDRILIIGGGPIGLCVLLGARALGATNVTLVEPIERKRQVALDLGADEVFAPDDPALELKGFGVSFDCVAAPKTLETAINATVGGGAVVVVGVPAQHPWDLPLARMQRFEVDLLGSGMYTAEDIDEAISCLSIGQINVQPLLSGTFPLASAAEAYQAAAQPNTIKTLLQI